MAEQDYIKHNMQSSENSFVREMYKELDKRLDEMEREQSASEGRMRWADATIPMISILFIIFFFLLTLLQHE